MEYFNRENNDYEDLFECERNQNMNDLFSAEEAFMLGNAFRSLYMSYCGFSNYCFQPINRRQQLLLEVQIYHFFAHELNLYLDIYPKDKNLCNLYNKYIEKKKKAVQIFEEEFGPLVVSDSKKCPFQWIQGPWPWENQ